LTSSSDGLAAIAMYPFEPARRALDLLWARVHDRLGFGPAELSWHVDPHDTWLRPDLFVGQACGWPLVTRLRDAVEVIGTFDSLVPDAYDGTYRSVIISRSDAPLAQQLAPAGTRFAINSDDSLSGCISLHAVATEHGHVVDHPLVTGAHRTSVAAVAAGEADLASIDALSWAFICDAEPRATAALHVVGHGPRVPCLPLITAAAAPSVSGEPVVAHLRRALIGATAEPDVAAALSTARIGRFLARGAADYAPLLRLAPAQ
jgi:ABC-type phosphate/phosphonate transport system substrate-binding protein